MCIFRRFQSCSYKSETPSWRGFVIRALPETAKPFVATANFNSVKQHTGCKLALVTAGLQNRADLQEQFAQISLLTKKVRNELYRILVEETKYFG